MARVVIAIMLLTASSAVAQDRPPSPTPVPAPTTTTSPTVISVDKLPISLDRIQKKLAIAPPTTNIGGLKLEYYIQVYGTAPRIDFFTGFDARTGPVPHSAPTHNDMLDVVTPRGFREPPMDIGSLISWLVSKTSR
jgi:hypothetical protein